MKSLSMSEAYQLYGLLLGFLFLVLPEMLWSCDM